MNCESPLNVIRTNSINEAFKALEKVDETIELTKMDNYQWKWVIIVLHNCVQCFMVVSLEGTNQADVIKDNTKDKSKIAAHLSPDENYNPTVAQVDYFMSLYNKVKYYDYIKFINGFHDTAMKVLVYYRNDFMHFFPKGLSMFIDDLPRQLLYIIDLVEYLLSLNKVEYKFEKTQITEMQGYIKVIRKNLKEASDLLTSKCIEPRSVLHEY